MEKKIKGYVIYEGLSEINKEPIVAIATLTSKNEKTGNMVSLWILHSNIAPTEAVKSGEDEAICGLCPHRHFLGGACYVLPFQAPSQIYKSYKRGDYPTLKDFSLFNDLRLRFGAYGDPLAIPNNILENLVKNVSHYTSYTHQWKNEANQCKKVFSMASTDNLKETLEAQKMGWRTFRVTNNINDLLDTEMICPNTTHEILCKNCVLCSGTSSKAKSIVIEIHGAKKKRFKG